jgi:hypothetical protein
MSMRTLVRIRNLLYECEGVSRLCAGAAWQISGIVGLSAQAAHLALCLLDLFARSIALITTSTGPEHLRPHSVFLIRSAASRKSLVQPFYLSGLGRSRSIASGEAFRCWPPT